MKSGILTTLLLLLAGTALASSEKSIALVSGYAQNAGSRVEVFEDETYNYRLDLRSTPYVFVDYRQQIPEARFAAMRTDPAVFSIVIAEEVGVALTPLQYAELVTTSMKARFAAQPDFEIDEFRTLGERAAGDQHAVQLAISGRMNAVSLNYVVSVLTRGGTSYQLLTWGAGSQAAEVQAEANTLLAGFSIADRGKAGARVPSADEFRNYRSDDFGYGFNGLDATWFPWTNVTEDYANADMGLLGANGHAAIVIPVCWNGAAPTQSAIFNAMFAQFGESYPAEFISHEEPVERSGPVSLNARYLRGADTAEGSDYDYHFWVTSTDHCAYVLAAWSQAGSEHGAADVQALWRDFDLRPRSANPKQRPATGESHGRNAAMLHQIGQHYFDMRSFREAFRFHSQAAALESGNARYVVHAIRALTSLEAYREALDWAGPKFAFFPGNDDVASWDAWLHYQTGAADSAAQKYRTLFGGGYRSEEDFAVFMELLADEEQWEEADETFNNYTRDGVTQQLQMLQARLLSRRGRHDQALALLERATDGRPFSSDLIYAQMEIHDAAGDPAKVVELAETLIDKGYKSLESYFYKGGGEFQLKSYHDSRESFERALEFAPGNSTVKDYLNAIDAILGEGDNSAIADWLEPVPLPEALQTTLAARGLQSSIDGYGAFYLSRIVGFDYDGSEEITQTFRQQVKIVDANGIDQFGTLTFDFNPGFEKFHVNSLSVLAPSGEKIAEGNPASYYITNSTNSYEASNDKTVNIPVPSLTPGVVIDIIATKVISVDEGEFPLEHHYLAGNRPISYGALYVIGQTKGLQHESFGLGPPDNLGKTRIWTLEDPPVYRWEPLQPYYDQILPWVRLGTVDEGWREAGSAYLELIRDKLDVEKVSERAARLVAGEPDIDRKIDILGAYVQKEIHYKAIEFGRRAYIPKTARETLRDRYGDCKDHAVLLYSLLRAVNIPAELALVNLQQQVLRQLPNVDQFDHMIVAVPGVDEHLFIDPTDKDLRLGRLPPRTIAGGFALLLGEAPTLMKIPEYEGDATGLRVERSIEYLDSSVLNVSETGVFSGYQAAELRGQLRTIETSALGDAMQRWVAGRYADAEVVDYFVDNVFDTSRDLVVELQYRLPVESEASFDLPAFMEASYLEHERVADRRFPFERKIPLRISTVTTLDGDANRHLGTASKRPDRDESRYANWRKQSHRSGDSWVIELDYRASAARFGSDEYHPFADFHRRLVSTIEQPVNLQ